MEGHGLLAIQVGTESKRMSGARIELAIFGLLPLSGSHTEAYETDALPTEPTRPCCVLSLAKIGAGGGPEEDFLCLVCAPAFAHLICCFVDASFLIAYGLQAV